MPPRVKVSKEDVITACLNMVRECGADALNARALATYIGCSTQPIFSNYSSMTELKQEVLKAADSIYQDFLRREMESGQYPPYKASGIGYIRFAKEEKELFKMLFMREREAKAIKDEFDGATREIIEMMQKSMGWSYEKAKQFHLRMWIFVHGIAALLATSYLPLAWEDISNLLTDMYQGMVKEKISKEG